MTPSRPGTERVVSGVAHDAPPARRRALDRTAPRSLQPRLTLRRPLRRVRAVSESVDAAMLGSGARPPGGRPDGTAVVRRRPVPARRGGPGAAGLLRALVRRGGRRHRVYEPGAMVVATVDAAGRAGRRTVLLKGLDADGLTFFTNLDSVKARQLAANPRARPSCCGTRCTGRSGSAARSREVSPRSRRRTSPPGRAARRWHPARPASRSRWLPRRAGGHGRRRGRPVARHRLAGRRPRCPTGGAATGCIRSPSSSGSGSSPDCTTVLVFDRIGDGGLDEPSWRRSAPLNRACSPTSDVRRRPMAGHALCPSSTARCWSPTPGSRPT